MKYSILVNTCDNFEDCWNPFFALFKKYWSDYTGTIFLNTEYKTYEYSGLTIVPVQGSLKNKYPRTKRATWSQCLKWALESINTDIILYLQEDYFIKGGVKNDIVEMYVNLMLENPDIKCIHLTDQSVLPSTKSEFKQLDNVKVFQEFRVSCQAALWRKQELMEILRTRESAWDFEHYGSKRSSYIGHRYLVVDKTWVKLNAFEIIPYIFTGIVKGRWIREAKTLFDANGIDLDFSIRGFVDEPKEKRKTLKTIFYNRYNMYLMSILNWIDLMKIRLKNNKKA